MRNLILTGGIGHPFEDAAPALGGVLGKAGFQSDIVFDIEAGLKRLDTEEFDLLTVYALRWTMAHGEKYIPHRAQWAFSLSPEGRERLSQFVSNGGSLLALHTAVICFDDWPEWGEILGGSWVWGRSSHPPRGEICVDVTSEPSPLTRDISSFTLHNDEVYGNLKLRDNLAGLLTAHPQGALAESDKLPVLWTGKYGKGNVVCNLLGHDRASLEHPTHELLLRRSVLWLMEQSRVN